MHCLDFGGNRLHYVVHSAKRLVSYGDVSLEVVS